MQMTNAPKWQLYNRIYRVGQPGFFFLLYRLQSVLHKRSVYLLKIMIFDMSLNIN